MKLLGIALLLGAPCIAQAAKVERMQMVMGTLLHIEAEAADEGQAEEAVEQAFERVRQLDEALSNYKEDSEISRINRDAFAKPVPAGADTMRFLALSKKYHRMTRGAFDATVEPLTRLWGLRERNLTRLPTADEIAQARAKVNSDRMELSSGAVRFLDEGMGIDTGGIGKGYALDLALERLKSYPIDRATLNFGGEILHWSRVPAVRSIAIRHPAHPRQVWKTVQLSSASPQAAFSTSGNYERYITLSAQGQPAGNKAERKMGHLIDLRSGEPADTDVRSVTVVSASAAEADALSTAIFVLGSKEGAELARSLQESGALILYESQGRLQSFKTRLWDQFVRNEEGL